MRRHTIPIAIVALAVSGTVRAAPPAPPVPPSKSTEAKPTPASAKTFVDQVSNELKRLTVRQATADWIKSTYITDDTERNSASLTEDLMAYQSQSVLDAARYNGIDTDTQTKRLLQLLKVSITLPAPSDPAHRSELATIAAKLEGIYGKAKYCGTVRGKNLPPADEKGCRDLQTLSEILAKNRDYDSQYDAWFGWHTISAEMKPLYTRQVELANTGAKEIGYRDVGELWRAGYDMSPTAFEAETERLWQQVKPLYEDLHCYVRGKLQSLYDKDRVPSRKPIPAHLLGNMWAQEWSNLYPVVEPYPGQPSLDVDAALAKQQYDATKMVKMGENFYTSLGLDPLPKSFWERSMFTRPRDREVVCHASAWDVTSTGDLRIKMCIKPTEEDLVTIHHELGHNYYQRAYLEQPFLFQNGANDGFHEAIGDAIALSITPGYLKKVGLISEVPKDEKGLINVQMKRALDKVAFLPFGRMIDQWRWDVFSKKVSSDRYNAAWWELRRRYQGIDSPVARTEEEFDPGAKYHIPGNVPYTRYFLAHIYQFQFHKALCQAAGFRGPLHECSIYESKDAGKKFKAMMEMGAAAPWPEAFEKLTGTRQADASALLEYFAPLRAWLKKQNAGQQCGW